jgi:acetyl-CoA synthetase (ADP-forming)
MNPETNFRDHKIKRDRLQKGNALSDLEVFLNPKSVAIIGASERPGSWGSFIMRGLLSLNFSGRIYPVNSRADHVFGIPSFKNIRDINESVALAICAIPEQFVEETIKACGQKGVQGITIITAGFAETSERGGHRQATFAELAHSFGMRLMGPNVSGTFNLHADFDASSIPAQNLLATPLAAVCQGGYAFYDILSSGRSKGLGVGKFIHTGNECDLTVTDFLHFFGNDPEVKAVVMYIEAIRDGKRFIEVARKVARKKPVVVYKAGRTTESARAAQSHTGALAGDWEIYKGLLHQLGAVFSPAMELLLPIGHALIERPHMRGRRTAIITVGGSWGVALTDCLTEAGLSVPEFSPKLQKELRFSGMPARASVKNPVDFGASGLFLATDFLTSLGRAILSSGEVDALILHGIGRPGMHSEETTEEWKIFLEIEKQQVSAIYALEKEFGIPVLIGSHYNQWESQAVSDLNKQGVRIYNRLHEIAWLLSSMVEYGMNRKVQGN